MQKGYKKAKKLSPKLVHSALNEAAGVRRGQSPLASTPNFMVDSCSIHANLCYPFLLIEGLSDQETGQCTKQIR